MRTAPGEILALVRAALRENPRGLTAAGVSHVTGLEPKRTTAALKNYESLAHVERRGTGLDVRWFLPSESRPRTASRPRVGAAAAAAVIPEVHATEIVAAGRHVSQLPPRSIFDPRPLVAPICSPGSSRVMRGEDCFVPPDDFTPGAFMADWARRTGTTGVA